MTPLDIPLAKNTKSAQTGKKEADSAFHIGAVAVRLEDIGLLLND